MRMTQFLSAIYAFHIQRFACSFHFFSAAQASFVLKAIKNEKSKIWNIYNESFLWSKIIKNINNKRRYINQKSNRQQTTDLQLHSNSRRSRRLTKLSSGRLSAGTREQAAQRTPRIQIQCTWPVARLTMQPKLEAGDGAAAATAAEAESTKLVWKLQLSMAATATRAAAAAGRESTSEKERGKEEYVGGGGKHLQFFRLNLKMM